MYGFDRILVGSQRKVKVFFFLHSYCVSHSSLSLFKYGVLANSSLHIETFKLTTMADQAEPHESVSITIPTAPAPAALLLQNSSSNEPNGEENTNPTQQFQSHASDSAIASKCASEKEQGSKRGEAESESESENDSGDETSMERKGKRIGIFFFILAFESAAFALAVAFLIMSFTVDNLHIPLFWDLGLWKLCMLVFTIICGRLISLLFTKLVLFLIWRFWINERALYFGYGIRKAVLLFVWVGIVTLAWGLVVDRGVDRRKHRSDIVRDVTRGLAGCLIGAFLWLLKTLLVKLVGCVHATKLLDKTNEAICVRKLLISLLGLEKSSENGEDEFHEGSEFHPVTAIDDSVDMIAGKVLDKIFVSDKHDKDRTSRQTMKELMNAIRGKKLLPLPHGDEMFPDGEEKKPEEAAKETVADIFSKVSDPNRCISLDKIVKFVKEKKVIDQLKGLSEIKADKIESKSIQRSNRLLSYEDLEIEESVFTEWMVEVYKEHDSLNSTLKHSKTAIDELNMIASVIVVIIIIAMWLLFMGFLTTKVLVFLSSQLLLAVFMFGNSVKTVFEAVIFVFLVHPFDVGDRCVVNGVQMIVDEMNILTTTFLRWDNEKIYYPNAVLASKPISNFYRSPPMSEIIEFAIGLHTPKESIDKLRDRIKTYLLNNPRWWRPDHSLQFREIENVNRMKLALVVNHTINFHYIGKRFKRRSDLVLEMKYIFEELEIEYTLLPQQVKLAGSVKCLPQQLEL